MNSDSITRLTHGLFDDIDNLKSVDNYAYDKTNDFKQLEMYWKKLENGNDMTVFQLYDWYKNINQLLNKNQLNGQLLKMPFLHF